MSGPDSSPNFDWLKRELSQEMSGSGGSDSSTSLANHLEEPAAPEAGPSEQLTPEEEAASDSSLDDFDHVPDPVLNESDGTTVIISNRRFDGERPSTSSPASAGMPTSPPLNFPNKTVDAERFSAEEFSFTQPPSPPRSNSVSASEASPPERNSQETDAELPSTPIPAASPIWENPHSVNEKQAPSDAASPGDSTWETAPEAEADIADQHETAIFKSDQVPPSAVPEAGAPPEDHAIVFEEPSSAATPQQETEKHTEILRAEDLEKARMERSMFEGINPGPMLATPTAGKSVRAPKPNKKSKAEPGTEASSSPPAGPSRMFIILASYASAITIAFLAMLMQTGGGRAHQLESLPDIPAEKADSLTYVPADLDLPAGHTLRIGDKQRYGNILVEPLAIVREPASFVHYSGDASRQRPATQPVWKLKVRLTNVSKDQEIAPLDRRLVLRWVTNENHQQEFTNYFITESNAGSRDAPSVQLYRLPLSSDWDLQGQDLGRTLQPGESYETYLASAENGLESLPEDLVWRVQIRKGYSPQGHGVTTVFEVAFKKQEVRG